MFISNQTFRGSYVGRTYWHYNTEMNDLLPTNIYFHMSISGIHYEFVRDDHNL